MITSKVDFGQTIYVHMFYIYIYLHIEVVNHVAWLLMLIYLNLFFQDEFFVFLNLGIPHHLVKMFGIFGQANLGFCRG